MVTPLLGIHHVTAIVDEPQENIDFYTNVLGLRLVKQTVNFDDPYTYHFYYGDEAGRPGTIVTFFSWPSGRRGSRGVGQISAMAFAVPAGALGFWQQQLREVGWNVSEPEARVGGLTLSLYDPAGLLLELVERPVAPRGAGRADIPAEAAIAGLYGVTMTIADGAPTAALLTAQLGFRRLEGDSGRPRFAVGEGEDTAIVTLEARPDMPRGQVAAGSVHHVAWRVADEQALLAWRGALEGENPGVTPVRDRRYFRSIYFREPGGVLFELATDEPGFATDEGPEDMGARLMLPPWLEPRRAEIEQRLPPISPPGPREAQATATKEVGRLAPASAAATPGPAPLGFEHVFEPARVAGAPTLLLLHGTGGNEHDLLDLGRTLYPGAALLSPRGKILENGMPRFFRRLAEGVFDLEDLRRRTHELADFVGEAAARYDFDPAQVVAVGFSNGANIAASALLLRPGVLARAVLFHAMVPFVPQELPDLGGARVFMGAGRSDPMVTVRQTDDLAALLRKAGAEVTLHWDAGGHGLNQAEVRAAAAWLRR